MRKSNSQVREEADKRRREGLLIRRQKMLDFKRRHGHWPGADVTRDPRNNQPRYTSEIDVLSWVVRSGKVNANYVPKRPLNRLVRKKLVQTERYQYGHNRSITLIRPTTLGVLKVHRL